MESLRTSLASRTSSRTHFQVLGLEASSLRKLPCPRLEDSTIFWTVKILLESARNLAENLRRPFFVFLKWKSPEKIFEDLFCLKKDFEDLFFELAWKFKTFFFFWEHLRLCPWSLALASRGSALGLGLEPCVLDSISGTQLHWLKPLKITI